MCVCYPLPALLLFNLIQGTSSTLFDVICHSGELANENVGNRLLFSAFAFLFIGNDWGAKRGPFGSS